MIDFAKKIAQNKGLKTQNVESVLRFLADDCTIAFIARYRKEATGCMNEVEIAEIMRSAEELQQIENRRKSILESLEKQGIKSETLYNNIKHAETLTELEDLYLPYKQKRKTRAEIAKQKGLGPLADLIMQETDCELTRKAKEFVNKAKGIANQEEALEGARDIVAAMINEDATIRAEMRSYYRNKAKLISTKAKNLPENAKNANKFEQWNDWSEKALNAPSHRIFAMFRGEKEGFIKLSVQPEDKEQAENFLIRKAVKRKKFNDCIMQKEAAARDCYSRLLAPSLETELRNELKAKADETAIEIFAQNLRQLLLAAPLGEKRVLAIDPGYRTGCKCVCLDAQGKLLHHDVIHLSDLSNAKNKLQFLANQFAIEAIAIGDGTASRETLQAVREISFHNNPIISMVNEDGASVYSASEIAREELGEYDITVRGAASIGRRLQDPLAELVKIDPKSIGVGQYQHDVNQTLLQSSLNMQVESCVNNVGVELNTASKKLLSYVSGIGETLAGNIIDYRNANGAFKSRKELLKVKRFGQKAFEQSAGFLRVRASKNPLDNTAVHPERYALVEQMAKDINCTVSDLINSSTHRSKIKLNQYISNDCGLPTLNDIMEELNRNSRDIRTKFEEKEFNNGVSCLEQLTVGQWLYGKVSNITAFGAFIDLGIHTDGLLHISSISKEYIGSVSEVLSLGQEVKVRVSEIDYTRKRISLSMLSEDKPKKHSNI